ncbi:MAG: type II toxin-antitoxin system PemK/MazF family toxin, partial [Rhizobiales bacterium]|nr:type II toxin-antitoxin system PemK/MazF family toxin [Hyphomicrobiales bacterium]
PASTKTVGCILVDQIRSIDRAARIFRHIEAVPEDVLGEVVDRLMSLLRA